MGTLVSGSPSGNREPQSPVITPYSMEVKPVIKLSFNGILLHANEPGIGFLENLSEDIKTPSVNYLLRQHPAILDPVSGCDFIVGLGDMNYFFSSVPFPEAGFVGLYNYRIEAAGAHDIDSSPDFEAGN